MSRYIIQGITDERDSCDCCGKTNLKRTVALSDTETGEDVFFGVICAARAMKIAAVDVRRGVASAEAAKAAKVAAERAAKNREQDARWLAHLVAKTGGLRDFRGDYSIFDMIQALGGFKAARAGFEW